jgi:hypothetical protein
VHRANRTAAHHAAINAVQAPPQGKTNAHAMAAKRITRDKKDALRPTKQCQKRHATKPCRNRLCFRLPCHKITADGITQMAINLGLINLGLVKLDPVNPVQAKRTAANPAAQTAVADVAAKVHLAF